MEYQFTETEQGAVLTGINGAPVHAVVPPRFHGLPAAALADYAFAGQRQLQTVELPPTVTALGDHTFYNCTALTELRMGAGMPNVGDGAFKNCRSLHCMTVTGTVHLTALLTDLQNEITLTVLQDGQTAAVLLFPEFDYEFLENVPPREFRSVTYGSGSFYRRCVSENGIDFAAYDETFARAAREDRAETVQRIALLRLCYPMRLSADAKDRYCAYLREQAAAVLSAAIEAQDQIALETLLREQIPNAAALDQAIELASQKEFAVGVSLLLEQRRLRFGGRKRFSTEGWL